MPAKNPRENIEKALAAKRLADSPIPPDPEAVAAAKAPRKPSEKTAMRAKLREDSDEERLRTVDIAESDVCEIVRMSGVLGPATRIHGVAVTLHANEDGSVGIRVTYRQSRRPRRTAAEIAAANRARLGEASPASDAPPAS